MKKVVMALAAVALSAVPLLAADAPSVERGRELFESSKLGSSGKSCATCHPGGRKLEWAGTMEEGKLSATINKCIAGPLKGKPLAPDSDDLKSLVLYLRSLAEMNR
jgi:mono/diheme cytochrome c family protein